MRYAACVVFAITAAPAFAQSPASPYAFSTLAGRASSSGSTDATGSSARFNRPHGVALDRDGNLLVTESTNHIVRKVTRDGVVTTIAGSAGNPGNVDGTGAAARFGGTISSTGSTTNIPSGPFGLALDSSGNAYTADAHYHTIRKITAGGVVTTYAGTANQPGTLDGSVAIALFNFPMATAVDSSGAVYVADTYNHVVRRISPTGSVTTIAGLAGGWGTSDGIGAAARFLHPTAIAISPNGTLYVADSANTVRRLTPLAGSGSWEVTTLAGTPLTYGSTDATGSAARFGGAPTPGSTPTSSTVRYTSYAPVPGLSPVSPTSLGTGTSYAIGDIGGLAADAAGNVFVADTTNNLIRKITAAGVVSTIAGSLTSGNSDGVGADARFQRPVGIAVDAAGTLFVTDNFNHTIRVGALAVAPSISSQPSNQTVTLGAPVVLSIVASGAPTPAYQWTRNGTVISGATGATLTLTSAQASDAGTYAVTLSNALGIVSTTPFLLNVTGAPSFTQQPVGQTITAGETIRLTATAAGSPAPTYQWFLNGQPVAGATGSTLTIPNGQLAGAGDYVVIATNSFGAATSNAARVVVNAGRIVNLSIRTALNSGDPLIVGFVAIGGTKPMLIRAIGPTLRDFGVTGAMPDPQLALYAGAALTASNDNWSAGAAPAQLAAAAADLGAFALPAGSLDAALLATVEVPMTAQVSTRPATGGIVLVELYDAAPSTGARLLNVSARTRVGTGDNILIAGFVVAGPSARTLLIRAIGPTLSAFGVTGALADPQVTVFAATDSTTARASNDNWAGTAALTAAFGQVGAFPLPSATSRDAALITTLAPGAYTAQVSGVGNATGEALLEIYELP